MATQGEAEQLMLDTPEVDRIRHWSKLYSAEAHLAGDLAHAENIRDEWRSCGIPTELAQYKVLQNFPTAQSLKLHGHDGSVAYEASLTEDEIPEDPTSSPSRGLPAFHGFSANGDVSAEVVYANWGTLQDFELLAARGISVKGKIVICKYAKVFRGLKVRAAEMFGAVGVIMYNDPQEDGQYTTKNGYKHFPDGPARHPKTIQRGSVDFFSVAVGDPTTPGYPSLPDQEVERKDPTHAIPKIPSLPISYADATPFLKALNGCGLTPAEIGGETGDWKGEIDGVEYCTGPSNVKVSLLNQGDYKYAPIYNVIGRINGQTDECVVLGNHHDSWCCGAIDPVSGTAAMNEVARGLGNLLRTGWMPLRTIILCNWDNEEYGLVGSTEWGEDQAEYLSKNCVAYLNVDESTNGGTILGATGSPLLNSVLRDVTCKIPSPITEGKSVYDDWLLYQQRSSPDLKEPGLTLMGTGSDYTVFFDHLGIPSIDMLFNQQGQGVYPYHSNYDSYYWVDKFGDVGFKKHLAMTQLWGLLTVRFAGASIIPFSVTEYAVVLIKHATDLKARVGDVLQLQGLEDALIALKRAAEIFDASAQRAAADGKGIVSINKTCIEFERTFLLEKGSGLPGRPWYRHMIFAPGLWYGYDGVAFPGVLEALDNDDTQGANQWVQRITTALGRATNLLDEATKNC